jgi:hypothetical protein
VLADPEAMTQFADRYTSALDLVGAALPAPTIVDVLEGVIAVVRELATAALNGLLGLTSMAPKGTFLSRMNVAGAGAARYYAIASDYQATDANILRGVQNIAMHALFGAPNDLVVPTARVWEANGSGRFPIADHLVFPPAAGVDHGGYFANLDAQQQILQWLN